MAMMLAGRTTSPRALLVRLVLLPCTWRCYCCAASPPHQQRKGAQLLPPRWASDPAPNKTLFLDNALFANLAGDLGLRYHAAAPAGTVLVPSEPWESFGYIGYHSVVQAGPHEWRMYYDTGWAIPSGTDFHRYTCLATSTDGVHWIKPTLHVATFQNSSANNIVWPRDGADNSHAAGTVFLDTNPAAPPDERWKMVAQWNIGGVHPLPNSAGVYMMKSADGIKFEPMFNNRSLDWSDTKNVMFFDLTLNKYIAYIRIDSTAPANPIRCHDPWLVPGRRVGRCIIGAEQLHDWSLTGCTSKGPLGDIECSKGPRHDCTAWGPSYTPFTCASSLPTTSTSHGVDQCSLLGSCGGAPAMCNGSHCVIEAGGEPGPLCHKAPVGEPGTAAILSFDEEDPGCLDIYTSSATPYEGAAVLLFPSAYQHRVLAGAVEPNPHAHEAVNDGLVDVRFAFQRHVLEQAAYPPTRNGRSPFVPLGVNRCPALVMAPGAPAVRFDWCYNSREDLNESAIDTGTKYMATGYVVSPDGSQLSLYSGGTPESHGGGFDPANHNAGSINIHSGIKRHTIRRDGFVGLESGYGGAHLPPARWPQMVTVPLLVPMASACHSGDVEMRANLVSGVGGGAYFQLEQHGAALPSYGFGTSVLLSGNWIDGPVSWGGDASLATRVLTNFSGQTISVRVAMRDAELFSVTMGCVQRPHYTECHKAPNCSAWGAHYHTIPCITDGHCSGYGTCANHTAKCVQVSGERVCVVAGGNEPGPICGWF